MTTPYSQRIATALTMLIIIALGLQLSWWSWHFIAPAVTSDASSASTGAGFEPPADYKKRARQLFGGDGSTEVASMDAAYVASDISLKGVFAVDGKTLSAAVVNLGGKDQVVVLNQALSNGAKLTEVHAEYIMISRAGSAGPGEKIMLDQFRSTRGAAGANTANAGANVGAGTGTNAGAANAGFRLNVANAGLNSYSLSRQELNTVLQDQRQLEFLGRIGNAPNGGIRVDDAPANSLSSKLGLRPGDIISNVNGQPVNGTGDLARLYQQFATLSQVRIELKRGGAPMLLTYAVQN